MRNSRLIKLLTGELLWSFEDWKDGSNVITLVGELHRIKIGNELFDNDGMDDIYLPSSYL